ncbi:hypothetical protein [Evansella clarkii]|uniref:hypothetical protein n=1 Tax=Evansella clarkii TaxID=79879 RepID=UPI000998568F|nr:hypothetical protein [Evansella clarkii]
MNFDITEIINEMPDFETHEEARSWFKKEYEDRFSYKGSEEVDGKRVHYYHLIKEPESYRNYMESFGKLQEHEITHQDTFESYSTIEVSEDGGISFSLY